MACAMLYRWQVARRLIGTAHRGMRAQRVRGCENLAFGCASAPRKQCPGNSSLGTEWGGYANWEAWRKCGAPRCVGVRFLGPACTRALRAHRHTKACLHARAARAQFLGSYLQKVFLGRKFADGGELTACGKSGRAAGKCEESPL